jgi:DNA polymerase III delta subunit
MIIFLYGPDSYRRREKLKEIVAQYRKDHQSVGFFDFKTKDSDDEFDKLREFCASHSLFENVKLAVVENILADFAVSDDKKNQKSATVFLKSNLENKELTVLISESKAPPQAFDLLLKKPVLSQEFKHFSADQFEFFIKKEAEMRGLKLTADALTFLAENFKEDSWGVINELEKLSLFNEKNFNSRRLREVVDYNRPIHSNEFFNQIKNLLWSRSFEQRLVNLEFLLHGSEPAKIFNFLASFSTNSLELTRKFADYDIAVKSGKMEYEEALMLTIF